MDLEIIQPYHQSNVRLFGKMYMSQLTLPILAALVPPDVNTSITDENVKKIDFNEHRDLVCISTITPAAPRAYQIADEFRKRGVSVVLGGVHPTLVPNEAAKYADSVVLGEAEELFSQVINDFRKGGLKKFYRKTKRPILMDLPQPRRELMNEDAYVNIPKVETSRGCPFNCSFCSTTVFFGHKMRYRPVKEVVEELKTMKERFVFFTDNNIVGSPKYAKELFKAITPLKLKWISQSSVNLAKDLELLKLAAQSGCVGMLIGFESLAKEALLSIGKKVNKVQDYIENIKRIHAHRIGVIGCFVFGFDQDDKGVFKRTLDFVKKFNIEVPQFTLLTPYPGTALRKQLEEAGRILHNQWDKYDATHVTFTPKLMAPQELRQGYDRISKKAFSYWSIFKRTARSLPYLKSLYRYFVFWQINLVYRKLWQVSREEITSTG